MRARNYQKKRNDVNNTIKLAKCDYFKDRIDVAKKDPKQTWKLLNELRPRKTSNADTVKEIIFLIKK